VCKKGETGLKRENFSNQKQFGWFGWEDDMIIFMGFGGGVQMVSLLDERLFFFFFFFFFFLPFPLPLVSCIRKGRGHGSKMVFQGFGFFRAGYFYLSSMAFLKCFPFVFFLFSGGVDKGLVGGECINLG